MKFRVGACALLVCLAGCGAEAPDMKSGQKGTASADAGSTRGRPSVQLERTPSQSVANAPDRGALIDYKNKGAAIKRQGAYTWYPVAISEAHAMKAVVVGEMTIPSPDGSQVKVQYDRHVEHPDGNWTWIGRVVGGDQRQEAILTFGEKAVFGSIPQKNGFALSLQTRNGVLYAVQADLSKVKSPNTGTTDVMVPPAMALRSALLASAPKAQVAQAAVEGKATAANTIDVAIGFTQGFAADLGSESAAVTRLVNLIDVGNQAFRNSLITGALRLVRAVPVTYTDTTTNQSALEQLSGFNADGGTVAVPASLAPIRTARDQYGADLAVLVRKFQMPENDGCGIAWLIGADQTPISPTIDDDLGYGVVSDGDDSYQGNSYFCAPESLVHELGHLMGSAHDRDNSLDDDGNLLYGRYPYSFGMKTTAANGNFYTIMAYGDDGQNFYRTFSNPLVLKCGPSANLACGVANQTDNARSLNQTIPVVATFRATIVPIAGARNDFNGDGRSDVLWRNSGTGVNTIWLSANSTTRQVVTTVANLAFKAVGAGDFNGDGAVDILWRNASTGGNTIWRSGNSSTTQAVGSVPGPWIVAGTGDFNGDGYDDILWRNPNTGANTIWRSGNSATVQAVTAVTNLAFKVAGVGDFDGDAKDDILWRNSTTGVNTIWRSGNSSTIRAVASVPGSWFVADTGDFDGNGSFDILWRNSLSGANTIWLAGSSTTVQAVSAVASQAWKVEAVGDFNGDGRADILWRNSTSGANTIWRSGSSASIQAMTGVSDLSWQIAP